FAAQPLPAIDADMHREREPGLDAHMAQTQQGIDEVQIPVQALAVRRDKIDPFLLAIPVDVERPARLDASQHTDQSLRGLLPSQQRLNEVFFGEYGTGQVLDR